MPYTLIVNLLLLNGTVIALLKGIASNSSPFMQGVAMSYIAAYIFYCLQILIPNLIHAVKYSDFVQKEIFNVTDSMERIGGLLSDKNKLINFYEEKESIQKNLECLDLWNTPSREQIHGVELTVIQAIHEEITNINSSVDRVISYNALNASSLSILIAIDKSELHEKLETCYKRPEGPYKLVPAPNLLSTEGIELYHKSNLANDILECMEKYYDLHDNLVDLYNKLTTSFLFLYMQ